MKPENSHTARLFMATRQSLGLSIRALAKRLQIPASSLSRIESGKLSPNMAMVQRLVELAPYENLESLFINAYRSQ